MSTVTQRNTSWATGKTWASGELVTATMLNDEVRDQDISLKQPASFTVDVDEASDYSTTSTSWTDIDATDLSVSITTAGNAVEVTFSGNLYFNGAGGYYGLLDLAVDGTRHAGDDGRIVFGSPGTTVNVAIPVTVKWVVRGLSAGSHTFKLQWRVTNAAATLTMYAGAGTADRNVHPIFYAVENGIAA